MRRADLRQPTAAAATCSLKASTRPAGQSPRPRQPCSSGRRIPEPYRDLESLEFSKLLLNEAKVAVVPGIGFGDYGDNHVRFALIENEERTRQALRGIKAMLAKGVVPA